MKVSDLFEAQAPSAEDKKKLKLSGGAYYAPRYDDDRKYQVGSVIDWLKSMDISKDDIAEALEQFKKTEIFEKTLHGSNTGVRYREIPTSEKNGTLTFDTTRQFANGRKFVGSYKIYANGLIRYSTKLGWGSEAMGRLKSPKARMRAGDPVGSLVGIWTASLKEVFNKWEKVLDRELKSPFSYKGLREQDEQDGDLS